MQVHDERKTFAAKEAVIKVKDDHIAHVKGTVKEQKKRTRGHRATYLELY